MDNNISIESKFNNLDTSKVKHEQKQELFECIRHFMKYMAFQQISDSFPVPDIANIIRDDLIKLFEFQYESSPDEKPE